MPQRSDRRPLLVVLALCAIPAACWVCSSEEPPPPPAPPLPVEPVAAVAVAEPVRAPVVVEPAPVFIDASVPIPDAGRPNPTEPELEAYLKKWRDALEPIFRDRRPQPVKAITAQSTPDAGAVVCERGTHKLALNQGVPIDYLVAVDTSGSMRSGGLEAASELIAYLDYFLARAGGEYRIIVLAEPEQLQLGDAGIARRRIESHDGLDVMLKTAIDEKPRWLSMLRANSEVRVLLITDDQPKQRDAKPYVEALGQLFAARPYSFSVVGGFEPTKLLLGPDDAPSTRTCRPLGINSGVVYQQVAIETKGYRASLCNALSRTALIEQLLQGSALRPRCAWNLGPKAQVSEVRAGSQLLLREFSVPACNGVKRGYLLDGPMLTLCADTCSAMKDVDELEVRVVCDR